VPETRIKITVGSPDHPQNPLQRFPLKSILVSKNCSAIFSVITGQIEVTTLVRLVINESLQCWKHAVLPATLVGKNGKEMDRKIRGRIGKGKREMGEDGR